jgi:hypothetical protein
MPLVPAPTPAGSPTPSLSTTTDSSSPAKPQARGAGSKRARRRIRSRRCTRRSSKRVALAVGEGASAIQLLHQRLLANGLPRRRRTDCLRRLRASARNHYRSYAGRSDGDDVRRDDGLDADDEHPNDSADHPTRPARLPRLVERQDDAAMMRLHLNQGAARKRAPHLAFAATVSITLSQESTPSSLRPKRTMTRRSFGKTVIR